MAVQRLVLAGLGVVVAACAKPAPPVDESASAAGAIREADIAWEKLFTARDTAAAIAMVEEGGSVLAPNAPIATGPIALRGLFEGFYRIPALDIHWAPTKAEAARSGDLGYSTGKYHMTFNDARGNQVVDSGKYLTVWRRQADSSWKVVSDVFNSDIPLPAAQ